MIEGQPKYAYEPEAQAIAVAEAQAKRSLIIRSVSFFEIQEVWEENLLWYTLNSNTMKLYSQHCNETLIQKFKNQPTQKGLEIKAKDQRKDFTFGRSENPVAAVLLETGILYISPCFDFQKFVKSNLRKKASRHYNSIYERLQKKVQ